MSKGPQIRTAADYAQQEARRLKSQRDYMRRRRAKAKAKRISRSKS